MKAELRSCRSTLGVLRRRLRARYEVSNINGSSRSQNVRYQCANVGFLALKLPSHSGIIQARIVCRRPTIIRRQFLAEFLIVGIPLRAASASPHRSFLPLFLPHLCVSPSFVRHLTSTSPGLGSHPPRRTVAMSLITATTTATTSYRPGHLLENNIHKVEPRRYDRLFLLPLSLSLSLLLSLSLPHLILLLVSSSFSLSLSLTGWRRPFTFTVVISWLPRPRPQRKVFVLCRRIQNEHVERVVRYFISSYFDNHTRLLPTLTSSCITRIPRAINIIIII